MSFSRYLPITSLNRLGTCRRCMRISFAFAAGSLGAAGLAYLSLGPSVAADAFAVAATGLTALWIAHLVAFSWRNANFEAADSSIADVVERRRFMLQFAKAFGAAALVTALPIVGARAQSCISKGAACVLNGTPCCPGASCRGKFPNTYCQ